ncbi:MAG: type II secretion system F family protein [Candidatus Gygaella obscura]|nr:type II secretion system F family protein [Candidatus Gygaella obscura]
MPQFKYYSKDKKGASVNGILEAENKNVVIEELRRRQLTIITLKEVKKAFSFGGKKKVSSDDLVIFSRQLATMVNSGIPLVQSLDILGEQLDNKQFRSIIMTIRDDIQTGLSLSGAFAKHPSVFSTLYINMVKAGETSGMLDEILDRLAIYLEKSNSLKKKIMAAMIYPALVFSMAIIITSGLLIFVVPQFKSIFSSFGGKLPLPTVILIAISDNFAKIIPSLIVLIIITAVVFSRVIKTPKGRFKFDQFKLKVFIFGKMFQMVAVSRFSRTLSTLVRSGVSILTALDIVSKTTGNKVIEQALDNVGANIKEGKSIALPLAEAKVFPPMVVRMISVGEQSGELEKMLTKISDFYDEQVDIAVSGLSSVIEPVIIIFLGLVIGSIVIAIFLPILKMSSLVGGM